MKKMAFLTAGMSLGLIPYDLHTHHWYSLAFDLLAATLLILWGNKIWKTA